MTIQQSHRPGFLNPVCGTVVWSLKFRVENVFEKKMKKKKVCETVLWSLVDPVKNLIEKKWPGLSNSDLGTDGSMKFRGNFQKILEDPRKKF